MSEFSGVTEIIAAIAKKVKKSLRLQAIIRMMQKPGNNLIQLVALIYLLLIFKFCPLTLPSCIIFHVVSPTRSTQEDNIILQVLIHTSVHFCMPKSILHPHLSRTPVLLYPIPCSLFLQHFLLFGSTTPLPSRCCNAQLNPK